MTTHKPLTFGQFINPCCSDRCSGKDEYASHSSIQSAVQLLKEKIHLEPYLSEEAECRMGDIIDEVFPVFAKKRRGNNEMRSKSLQK